MSGESGEDYEHTLKNLDSGESGEDYIHTLKNYDSSEEYEDFDNLTLSRAGFEERAINTCDCAPVSSSDRIVGGKEVNPKFKLPYQVLVSPCNSNGQCMMCGGTILNKRYVVTAAHCLFDGNTQLTVKGGAKFRVMVGEHDHCKHNEAGGKSYVLASVVHKHPKFSMDNPSGDNVDSRRASSTFSRQQTKSAKTSWAIQPPLRCFVPGPRVPTPARGIVVDPLPLPRMESTCSLVW